ncbi:MAG: TlpA disulfide reductase family protein [Candidatus Zixiibacteriota bacterium]
MQTQRTVIILLAIIVLMAIEIVYLVLQNRQLRAVVAETTATFNTLQQSQHVPGLTGQDLQGNPLRVHYSADAPRTILVMFSPGCSACKDNTTFWQELFERSASSRFRYLGMCVGTEDDARAYATEHGLTFPILAVTDERLIGAYNGHVLPQTAIVSPEGTIVKSWPGTLDETAKSEVVAGVKNLQ